MSRVRCFGSPTGRRLQNFTRTETFGDHAEADDADVQRVMVFSERLAVETAVPPSAHSGVMG